MSTSYAYVNLMSVCLRRFSRLVSSHPVTSLGALPIYYCEENRLFLIDEI